MLQIFGRINPPEAINKYASTPGAAGAAAGLIPFLNNLLKLLVVIGGIYALLNIILAGYAFLSAGDDPKKVAGASTKIWQSLIGLVIIAGSFVLAGIFGYLIFGDATAILSPSLYGP